jgi:hypothetical protein
MKPTLETLESRDLLAASLTGGVLLITGTVGSDSHLIQLTPASVSADGKAFLRSEVQRIQLESSGGYDIVRVEIPGIGQRLLRYGFYGQGDQFLLRSWIADLGFSVAVNRPSTADAFFSLHATTGGRAEGGFILDVGEPSMMIPPAPGVDEDGDLDDYAEIVRKHDEDGETMARLANKSLSPKRLASKLDKLLLRAGR